MPNRAFWANSFLRNQFQDFDMLLVVFLKLFFNRYNGRVFKFCNFSITAIGHIVGKIKNLSQLIDFLDTTWNSFCYVIFTNFALKKNSFRQYLGSHTDQIGLWIFAEHALPHDCSGKLTKFAIWGSCHLRFKTKLNKTQKKV